MLRETITYTFLLSLDLKLNLTQKSRHHNRAFLSKSTTSQA